jgi:hypothetical protein
MYWNCNKYPVLYPAPPPLLITLTCIARELPYKICMDVVNSQVKVVDLSHRKVLLDKATKDSEGDCTLPQHTEII